MASSRSSAKTARRRVLGAQESAKGRIVVLHVAAEPPGAVAAVRFLERATRLRGVMHPNVLPVFDARAVEGRAFAVAEAPAGRRLDAMLEEGPLPPAQATRIGGQVASAVEALEGAGAGLPPLTPERVWINAENTYLDPLDGRSLLARDDSPPSSPAAVAGLLETMVSDEPSPLREIVSRAHDGASSRLAGHRRAAAARGGDVRQRAPAAPHGADRDRRCDAAAGRTDPLDYGGLKPTRSRYLDRCGAGAPAGRSRRLLARASTRARSGPSRCAASHTGCPGGSSSRSDSAPHIRAGP